TLFRSCSVPDIPLLAAPTNVTAEPAEGGILVSWTDVSLGEEGFRVYRLEVTTPTGDPELVGTTDANVTSFLDMTGDPTDSYTYEVAAFAGDNETEATPQEGSPVSPQPRTDPDPDPLPDPDPHPDPAPDPYPAPRPSPDATPAGVIEAAALSGGPGGPDRTRRDAAVAATTNSATGGGEAGVGADQVVLPEGTIALSEI